MKKKKNYTFINLLICLFAVFSFVFFGVILAKNVLNIKSHFIDVSLLGDSDIDISYKSEYIDYGFSIKVDNEELGEEQYTFECLNDVDTSALGEYHVIYHINYKDNSYELDRIVNVKDMQNPVIKSDIDQYEVYECNINSDVEIKYTATDDYDGDITEKVILEREDDKIILSVADSSGNNSNLEIPIVKVANPSPKVTLKGTSTVYYKVGKEYIEQGYNLVSVCGNNVEDNVKIISDVDMSKEGEYKVTYKSGNNTVSRDVIVFSDVSSISNPQKNGKIVYLTFDDGPGPYTERLLNILAEYNVKATFFVTNQFPNYQNQIANEYSHGHKVAVHSLTHKWTIYKSVDAYVNDFNSMNEIIYAQTGQYSKLFRFPGGSSNAVSKNYAKGVVSAIASRMTKEGYVYFDWNVDSGDAAGASTAKIISNVTKGISSHESSVVLMHDIKLNTVNAIESIIVYGLNNGYTFETLDENSYTAHHSIKN